MHTRPRSVLVDQRDRRANYLPAGMLRAAVYCKGALPFIMERI